MDLKLRLLQVVRAAAEEAMEAFCKGVVKRLLKTRGLEEKIGRRVRRKKTMSKSKDWNQSMAAKLLGISTRQLRNYAKNPPDEHWPGWEDAILLKQWKNARDDRDKLNRALAKSLGYKEGFSEAFKRE